MISPRNQRNWASYLRTILLITICLLVGSFATTLSATSNPPEDDLTNVEYRYDNLPDAEDDDRLAEFRAISKWDTLNLTYYFVNGTAQLPADREHEIVRKALAVWAEQTPLTFTETDSRRSAKIEIGWAKGDHGDGDGFDGAGGVLAHAGIPNPFNNQQKVILHFDDAERWVDNPARNVDLMTVAIHEIGHTLGLDHSRDRNSIMFASYLGPQRSLGRDDVAGIQSLYGATNTPTVPPAQPPKSTSASPRLLAGVQTYLGRAIELEMEAFRRGDARVLAGIFADDVYDSVQNNISNLNDQGLVQISEIDYDKSYIADVRVFDNTHIEVDTCETWTSSIYRRADSQLQRDGNPTLLPQTLTIERLRGGWFITGVEFMELPAFCS